MKISEFIKALGGVRALAEKLDARAGNIRQWPYVERIPVKHHDRLHELAKAAGISLEPGKLGQMREHD